jgi:hypothetical protein
MKIHIHFAGSNYISLSEKINLERSRHPSKILIDIYVMWRYNISIKSQERKEIGFLFDMLPAKQEVKCLRCME